MSDILQAFWVSKPILSTSFLNQEVTCSPTERAEMSDKYRAPQRRASAWVTWGHTWGSGLPGLHSSPCCSFSPAYTSMHQAWKAKENRSSRREGGRTTTFRRFSHSWHCSNAANWHLGSKQGNAKAAVTFYIRLRNIIKVLLKKAFNSDVRDRH